MIILLRNPIASIISYSHGSSGLCCPRFQNSARIQKCVVPICRSSGGRLAFILVPGIPPEFRHVLYPSRSSGGCSSWFQEVHQNSNLCCTHAGVPVDVRYSSWFQEFHQNSDLCCTHARVPVDVWHSSW